jgi:hypothetical protein
MAGKNRQPPIHIPIPVEQFVEGLLKIDPKKLPAAAAKKKAAKKRKGKANRNNQAAG